MKKRFLAVTMICFMLVMQTGCYAQANKYIQQIKADQAAKHTDFAEIEAELVDYEPAPGALHMEVDDAGYFSASVNEFLYAFNKTIPEEDAFKEVSQLANTHRCRNKHDVLLALQVNPKNNRIESVVIAGDVTTEMAYTYVKEYAGVLFRLVNAGADETHTASYYHIMGIPYVICRKTDLLYSSRNMVSDGLHTTLHLP